MTGTKAQISYGSELLRKGIHIASLLIPIIYLQLEHWTGIGILLVMTAVSVLIDALMHFNASARRMMLQLVGPLLRSHELREDKFLLTGASWVLIAAVSSFLFFPTIVGVTAFTVLIVSDTFAALVGRRFGSTPFLDKSVVGTATFIVTSWGVVLVFAAIYSLPMPYIVCGAIAGMVGGIAEAGSTRLRLDDNISIPFSFALTMWIVGTIATSMGFESFVHALP